jgi:hypothetical protein
MQPAGASASNRLHTSAFRDAPRTQHSLSSVLNLNGQQAAVSAVGSASEWFGASECERRLPGEKQIGSAIWPNDRCCCCWAQLFLLVNACALQVMRVPSRIAHTIHTRGGGHILFKLVRATAGVCVCLGGTAGRTGANECTARFQGCICLNPPTHILRRQPI